MATIKKTQELQNLFIIRWIIQEQLKKMEEKLQHLLPQNKNMFSNKNLQNPNRLFIYTVRQRSSSRNTLRSSSSISSNKMS